MELINSFPLSFIQFLTFDLSGNKYSNYWYVQVFIDTFFMYGHCNVLNNLQSGSEIPYNFYQLTRKFY